MSLARFDPAEAETIADWQAGDILAGDRLVRQYEGLTASAARKYVRSWVDFDDLRQVGRLALLRAATRHNPAIAKFSTYAEQMVNRAVLKHMLRSRHPFKMPNALRDGPALIHAASMDATGDDGRTMHDTLAAGESTRPDVDALVAALTSVERDVIGRLFGPREETLEEIGASRGVTKQAVHAISSRAMARLRAAARSQATAPHT